MTYLYGTTEIEHLKKRDKRLGAAIEAIGPIFREVDSDLFSSVVHHIVGQQVSTAAQATVWRRLHVTLGDITAETILSADEALLQGCGMTYRKAGYIQDFAKKVSRGEFDVETLWQKSDAEVVTALSSLRGIGVWTAEMLMIFCMQRKDIVSFGDLAIQRGIRMLYRRPAIDQVFFERLRRRYSPYGTVASLYLWAIAGGALPNLKDPGAKKLSIKGKKEESA